MNELDAKLKKAKKLYDKGYNPLSDVYQITIYCLRKLCGQNISKHEVGTGDKKYIIFKGENGISRPCLETLFISSEKIFTDKWNILIKKLNADLHKIDLPPSEIDAVIYTAAMAFAMCYDIWKNSSRKTPGTYWEVLLGSIMGVILPDYKRTKHIPLQINASEDISEEDNTESVSTDIVFEKRMVDGELYGLVIPAKITTRERIVQAFAHQRILNEVFGPNRFNSILICISETQLDKKKSKVNEICVPGTIRLFQEHLAKLAGIFYLDPPQRYQKEDITKVISIGSVGNLLANYLPNLILRDKQR